MRSEGAEKAERFSSGGVVAGVMGLVAVLAVLGYGLFSGDAVLEAWTYPALLLAAVAIWTVLIRPAIVLHAEELELRNILHSRWVPYGRISSVAVKQITVVEVDDQRYVGSGFGRSRGTIRRDAKAGPASPAEKHSLGWLVEQKLSHRIADDRGRDDAPVRRTWAIPEIAGLLVLGVATVVAALIS